MAGTESTNMANGSSTSASTVVVTARDIEFSNYDSSTGKWGNAVMTMMIEDANTPDNINLEVYDERVYAVFRNHYDHTDTVRTSAEVDGMDFRVTISTPMVASGKYELYKVYGETSGREYATTSQFYFQVPGKVWDFANDTVEEDVELVSDWWNYGEVVTSDNVVHGFPTREDAMCAAAGNIGVDVSVNGETINTDNIVSYKLTSMFTGDITPVAGNSSGRFVSGYNNLQNLDIVSSGLTAVRNSSATSYSSYTLWSTSYNQKFGFPSTLRVFDGWFRNLNNVYNKPIYMPDNVERILDFFSMSSNSSNFTSKIRMSPNLTGRYGYNLYYVKNWAGSFEDTSKNVQLPDAQNNHSFVFGFFTDWGKGLTNGTWTAPSTWTYIPTYWMYGHYGHPSTYSEQFTPYNVIIPEGITSIHRNSLMNTTIASLKLPSTLMTISSTLGGLGGNTASEYLKLDMSACTNITGFPNDFLVPPRMNVAELKLPPNLTTIGSNFFYTGYNSGWPSYTNWPVDENNERYFEIPEGVTSLGSNCCGGVIANNAKLILPSTLTSVGTSFCYLSTSNKASVTELDLSQFSPEIFAESTQTFACEASGIRQARWKITVAPGTSDAWAERFPNRSRENNGNTYWTRYIEWVETPTPYGYLFYRPVQKYGSAGSGRIQWTGEEKMIELASQAEFEQLCNSSLYWNTTFERDGEEIVMTPSYNGLYGSVKNIITKFIVGTDVTSIPDYFLTYSDALEKVSFQENQNLTSIGAYFCRQGTNVYVEDSSTPIQFSLGDMPDSVTTIGDRFLDTRRNFNAQLHLSTSLKTVGQLFMEGCSSFNQPISLPDGIQTLSYGFMSGCSSFNQPIVFPDSLTSFGNFWLSGCSSFNQPIVVPSTRTSISNGFLSGARNFNSTITMPTVRSIGYSVLQNCTSFNQPLDLSNVTNISYSFMNNCTSFNQPITFPNNVNIGNQFLYGCTSFNSPITFAGTSRGIGAWFLSGCTAFDQNIEMPEVQSGYHIATNGFMVNCNSMESAVDFGTNAISVFNGDMSQNTFLATQDNTSDMYTKGVYILGDHKDDIVAAAVPYDGSQATPAGYYRNVKEYPTYGIVYYKTSASDSDEKEVELQSAAEFNSLVAAGQGQLWGQWTATVGTSQVQVTNGGYNYSTATNVVTGVRIGSSITTIPSLWMCFARGLSHMDGGIPSWVTSIGDYVFFACYSLEVFDVYGVLTSIGDTFLASQDNHSSYPHFKDNAYFVTAGRSYINSATSTETIFELPEGLTTAGDSFLSRNRYVQEHPIKLPSTLTSIGAGSFTMINSYSVDGYTKGLILDVGDLPATVMSTATSGLSNNYPPFCSGNSTIVPIYIKGSTAADWVARFPDLPDSVDTTHYRHLEVYQEPSS